MNAKSRVREAKRERERESAFEDRYYYRGNFKKVKNKVRAIFPRGTRLLVRSIQLRRNERRRRRERERERLSIFFVLCALVISFTYTFLSFDNSRVETRSTFLSLSFYHCAFD